MAEETRQGAYTERSPFYFQGSMDEQTLRRYTARAVTYQTLCDCETDIEEGLRLVTHVGAKFIGRAAHFSWKGNWTREQIEAYYALAARLAARAHEADPELIIQAGVFEIIYREATACGGLVSGEHGIGSGKIKYLVESVGETNMRLMEGIKHVFDPNMILNPGKVCYRL